MNKSKQEEVIKELKHEKVIGLQYFGPKRAKPINYWIALAEDIKTEDNLKWSQLFLLLTGVRSTQTWAVSTWYEFTRKRQKKNEKHLGKLIRKSPKITVGS